MSRNILDLNNVLFDGVKYLKGNVAIDTVLKDQVFPKTYISNFNYPYFNDNVDDIIHNYLTSKESVMLLYGDPGTGKTSFIYNIITRTDKNICIIDNPDVLRSPKLIPYLSELNNTLVIIEDADNLLGKRKDGNVFMKGLLNLTDGVIKNSCKFIFSTNLTDINDVEEALLRPGRCYGYYYFRKLTRVQANDLRTHLGMEKIDYISTHVSVADVLNVVRTADKPTLNKLGFI
jgi:SpoVK/Ycf46/Vps4 family AAA+-type ATPase